MLTPEVQEPNQGPPRKPRTAPYFLYQVWNFRGSIEWDGPVHVPVPKPMSPDCSYLPKSMRLIFSLSAQSHWTCNFFSRRKKKSCIDLFLFLKSFFKKKISEIKLLKLSHILRLYAICHVVFQNGCPSLRVHQRCRSLCIIPFWRALSVLFSFSVWTWLIQQAKKMLSGGFNEHFFD